MSILNKNKAPKLLDNFRVEELLLFQKQNNLKFKDINLLENAFVHSSYANESKVPLRDNERLEFLGDSVLSLSVSEYLYKEFNFLKEGEYTRIRSAVVDEATLAKVALSINVDKFICIGKGEEQTGGRTKAAILADCMEAIIAAIYLDKGFSDAQRFVLSLLNPLIDEVVNSKTNKDYKTLLQEYVQKRYKTVPVYTLVGSEGPEHNQVFSYTVEFKNKKFGPGTGKNKKLAEQSAAELAVKALNIVK